MGSVVFEMDANIAPIEKKNEAIVKILEKSNAHMIQKLEKLTLVMKDTIEKMNLLMQIMIRKMDIYISAMFDSLSSSMALLAKNSFGNINQICSNFANLEKKIGDINKDFEMLEKLFKKSSWNQYIATLTIGLIGVGATIIGLAGGF